MNSIDDRYEPLSDELLCAYVDGELDTAERLRVEARLARDPDAANFVARSRHLCGAVHRLYDRELERHLPPHHLMLGRNLWLERKPGRDPGRFRPAAMAAAAAATVVVAVAATFLAWSPFVGAPGDAGPGDAGPGDRRVAVVEPQAQPSAPGVESAAARHGDVPAASPADGPDFTGFGFRLVLTRLLPDREADARQFIYESDAGIRLVLYDGPARKGAARNLVLMQEGPRNFLSWRGDERAYSLIGDVDRDTLLAMGRAADASWGRRPSAVDPAASPGPEDPAPETDGSTSQEERLLPVPPPAEPAGSDAERT